MIKYRFIHIEDGALCLNYALAFQRQPNNIVFLCKRINLHIQNEYHYKMYKLIDKKLEGPVQMSVDLDLRMPNFPHFYAEHICNVFDGILLFKNVVTLSPAPIEKPNNIQVVYEGKHSGQELMDENSQKPDKCSVKVSPNIIQDKSYSHTITHWYNNTCNRLSKNEELSPQLHDFKVSKANNSI